MEQYSKVYLLGGGIFLVIFILLSGPYSSDELPVENNKTFVKNYTNDEIKKIITNIRVKLIPIPKQEPKIEPIMIQIQKPTNDELFWNIYASISSFHSEKNTFFNNKLVRWYKKYWC